MAHRYPIRVTKKGLEEGVGNSNESMPLNLPDTFAAGMQLMTVHSKMGAKQRHSLRPLVRQGILSGPRSDMSLNPVYGRRGKVRRNSCQEKDSCLNNAAYPYPLQWFHNSTQSKPKRGFPIFLGNAACFARISIDRLYGRESGSILLWLSAS
jgi:hypothetical protein